MIYSINDMTKEYDGFYLLNNTTGELTKFPYRHGIHHIDVEDSAIRDMKKIDPDEKYIVYGFVKKGEY